VPSEEGEDMEEDENDDGEDEEKQIRILQETTGMPREAFDGKLFVNLWTLHMRDSHRHIAYRDGSFIEGLKGLLFPAKMSFAKRCCSSHE
jgi:hypothetical protein